MRPRSKGIINLFRPRLTLLNEKSPIGKADVIFRPCLNVNPTKFRIINQVPTSFPKKRHVMPQKGILTHILNDACRSRKGRHEKPHPESMYTN